MSSQNRTALALACIVALWLAAPKAATVSLNAVSGTGTGSIAWIAEGATVGDDLAAVDSLASFFTGKFQNRRLFAPLADTTIASPDVIYSVKVRIRAKSDINLAGTYDGLKVGINLGGVDYLDAAIDEQGTMFLYYEHTWSLNPATATAWTWANVNALQAGCVTAKTARSQSTTYHADHAQIVVNYGPASNTAPRASALAVAGRDTVGDVLTGSYAYADAESDLQGATRFAWYRADDAIGTNLAAISGATGTTCVIPVVAEARYMFFEVTPVALTGVSEGASVMSAAFGPIAAPQGAAPVASNVTIAGGPLVGEVLTGSYTYSDANGDLESGTMLRWLRDGVAIAGATSVTYTLVAADYTTLIQFEVTPMAATGTPRGGLQVASTPLGPIDALTSVVPQTHRGALTARSVGRIVDLLGRELGDSRHRADARGVAVESSSDKGHGRAAARMR